MTLNPKVLNTEDVSPSPVSEKENTIADPSGRTASEPHGLGSKKVTGTRAPALHPAAVCTPACRSAPEAGQTLPDDAEVAAPVEVHRTEEPGPARVGGLHAPPAPPGLVAHRIAARRFDQSTLAPACIGTCRVSHGAVPRGSYVSRRAASPWPAAARAAQGWLHGDRGTTSPRGGTAPRVRQPPRCPGGGRRSPQQGVRGLVLRGDRSRSTSHLDPQEADAPAQILGAPRISERFADLTREVPGLSAGQVEIKAGGTYADRPLGETRAHTRTGASIVAVVPGEPVIASPGPAEIVQAGDVLVVIGTNDGLSGVVSLIASD